MSDPSTKEQQHSIIKTTNQKNQQTNNHKYEMYTKTLFLLILSVMILGCMGGIYYPDLGASCTFTCQSEELCLWGVVRYHITWVGDRDDWSNCDNLLANYRNKCGASPEVENWQCWQTYRGDGLADWAGDVSAGPECGSSVINNFLPDTLRTCTRI